MARPRSEEKVLSILNAATEVIASHGLIAPPIEIASKARVAEGTIFRYFPTKDDLLNAVFFHLKEEVSKATRQRFPPSTSLKERARSAWNDHIDWGIAHADASKALRVLSVSDRITSETRDRADALFPELRQLCEACADGALGESGAAFLDTLFFALAEPVMDFASRHPEIADACKSTGFDMLWAGLRKSPRS